MIKVKYIQLFFLSLIFLSCKIEDSTLIDETSNLIQSSNPTISPSKIDLDTILINGERNSIDTIKIKFTASVKFNPENTIGYCEIYDQKKSKLIGSGNLNNDGVLPDISKSDSVFTGNITATIQRSYIGKLNAILSISNNNLNFDKHILSIPITRSNLPPSISNLIIKDSITLSQTTQTIPITIQATDPDGLNDILKVELTSYRMPDTLTIRGKFQMFDDGGKNLQSGNTDSKEGDGIYTLSVQLPSNTVTGTYLFIFQATDKSTSVSNQIKKTIVIK
ncbi:MAG: hypothetical protein O3A55_07090 [Bacteroidetes bacterium]|nr:hypothetical protein [Bacteroidota bacterium]